MELGIKTNLDADVYHGIDAVSASRLKVLRDKTPEHLRHAIDHPGDTDTPAFIFGRAVHMATLEPEAFASHYAVPIKCDRRTREGKAASAEWEQANAGKEFLASDDYDAALAMAAKVHAHPFAGKLLARRSATEVSAFWTDEPTGLLCKMRADCLCSQHKSVIDLKTTQDANPEAFEKSIFDFGYHLQAAMYLDGLAACGHQFTRFVIVAVEKKPPYGICVMQLDPEWIELGRREYRLFMSVYKNCVTSGVWPGYPAQVQTVGVPDWVRRKLADIGEAA